MQTLWQDLRYGARILSKKPGFTLIVVLTLTLGIGANTAIFSVVNAVLLRPLPYKNPAQLVMVGMLNENPSGTPNLVSPGDFGDWTQQNRVFEGMAAFRSCTANLTGEGEPERIPCATMTASFFPVLGVAPVLGRAFLSEEDQPGRDRVVLLGHGLWQRRFGADPRIVGKPVTLDGRSYTVIGVMPADFVVPVASINTRVQTEMWLPMAMSPGYRIRRDVEQLHVIARLKPERTLAAAQAEMDIINTRLAEQYPDTNARKRALVAPLRDTFTGGISVALLVLLGAVSFLLLIACANVANLLLARGFARQREFAIRLTLGAAPWRLVRQLLTESVLLACAGAALGLLLALWSADALTALGPADIPGIREIRLDLSVLSFTVGVALLTGLVFGLVPALAAARPGLNDMLKEGGRAATTSAAQHRLHSLLVISEVALALVLLIGGALLFQGFLRLRGVDPGFRPQQALTAQLELPSTKYNGTTQCAAFLDEALLRLQALPGVTAVGAINYLPFSGDFNFTSFIIEGRPSQRLSDQLMEEFDSITPNYFRAMGTPLLRGRFFTEQDNEKAPPVVIINDALARHYWPDEDPLGKRIQIGAGGLKEPWYTVVGVVGDVRFSSLEAEFNPAYYVPHRQDPWGNIQQMNLVIRTTGEPGQLVAALRNAVWAVDKDVPVDKIRPLEELLSNSIAQRRFSMILLTTFAGLALLLAVVGIYGMISYSVTQRTHEIGIRMALGAESRDVLKLIMRQGMTLALIGVGAGLLASVALTRLMKSPLFGVSPNDHLTFTGVALLLSILTLLACFIPARRVTKVDSMIALWRQ